TEQSRHWGDRAWRSTRALLNQRCHSLAQASAGQFGKFLHNALIYRPFERNDQFGKVSHRFPAPADELGLVPAARACNIDFGILPRETHRNPFLSLSAIASLPGAACHGARNVIDQPVGDLADLFNRANAGLLVKLALGGCPGILARVDPAL